MDNSLYYTELQEHSKEDLDQIDTLFRDKNMEINDIVDRCDRMRNNYALEQDFNNYFNLCSVINDLLYDYHGDIIDPNE